MNIGAKIKLLRQYNGLTQKELAEKVQKSPQVISNWERGYTPNITNDDILKLANALSVKVSNIIGDTTDNIPIESAEKLPPSPPHLKRIPILGHVVAGNPTTAIEDIEGYEEIDTRYSPYKNGDFFALRVKGGSMQPTLNDGDIIIVKKQNYIEDREIAVVLVDGDEATVKEVKESDGGITLIGHNAYVYSPHFYSHEEIDNLPVAIIGKVVEMRRRF